MDELITAAGVSHEGVFRFLERLEHCLLVLSERRVLTCFGSCHLRMHPAEVESGPGDTWADRVRTTTGSPQAVQAARGVSEASRERDLREVIPDRYADERIGRVELPLR